MTYRNLLGWIRFAAVFTMSFLSVTINVQGQQTESLVSYTPNCDTDPYSFKRLDQGENWTAEDWNDYYTQDQGSWIMPYPWAKALRQPNGQLFLRDSLTR